MTFPQYCVLMAAVFAAPHMDIWPATICGVAYFVMGLAATVAEARSKT